MTGGVGFLLNNKVLRWQTSKKVEKGNQKGNTSFTRKLEILSRKKTEHALNAGQATF